jgi:hypothetical protein
MSLVACALMAIALSAAATKGIDGTPLAKITGEATPAAVFTGEFVDGKLLYRLPPIEVVAHVSRSREQPRRAYGPFRTPRASANGPSAKRQVRSPVLQAVLIPLNVEFPSRAARSAPRSRP